MRFTAALIFVCALTLTFTGIADEGSKSKMEGILPILFQDDFEDGLDGWEFTDPGAWERKKVDGDYVLALVGSSDYNPPVKSPKSIAWIKGLEAGDFVLEADVRQTGREYGHRDLCLFLGKQDASHFYYVHIASKADDHANSIFIVDGKPRTSIAKTRTEGTEWGNGVHHVKLERDVRSGSIRVYFDDMENPVMTAEDTSFGVGGIGVGSFDDVGQFDNVVVRGRKTEE